ncbi:type IV secretory system conjugative DNA transfer family protein [Sphingomonas sp.]|uniref:type IV secretory system conjugative DNA transfer family protein n=1 Tax=Sphingomonas sp. TaxID=28214 RepID=UPI002EDAE4F7
MTDLPGPSTYTPFFRRFFTDERAREIQETQQLYDWVKHHQDAFTETNVTIGRRVAEHFDHLGDTMKDPLIYALLDVLNLETQLWELPPPDFDRMNMREFVEYRNLLYAKQYFFTNRTTLLEHFEEGLARIFGGLADELPLTEDPSPFTIPLIYALPQPGLLIDKIYGTVVDDAYVDRGLFKNVGNTLYRNLCRISGREPGEASRKPWKNASDNPLPLDQMADQYLAGTTFHELFQTPIPLKLTHENRFSHMHILGGTNAGKTTLIESLIHHDLQSDDPPSIVLIDPHSDLVRRLTHTDLGLGDRLIIIDPRDIKHPPALNTFAVNKDRFDSYNEATQEQVTAGVIQTFNYLFSGLTNLTLTGKQDVFFRYVARLMLSMPDTMGRNATILDMMKLMHDPPQYEVAIAALPDIPREFFRRDFMSKTFEQTKEQIRYRLQAIIENPTMARLFTSTETKVDLFTELNRGAVILVDTAKDFLKENSSTFGRLFISLVLQAVLERAAIREADRKSTFLIVDEAASFFSSNIDDLLTEARKYKCGCVFAHQFLDQATGSLRASLAANTTIKFASGVSANDARAMAPEMRTTPDFILDQPRFHFAAHIRNVTPQAVTIPIMPVADQRQLSSAEFEELIARNRERVSLTPFGRGREAPQSFTMREEQQPPQHPDEDISPEW